jgi:hypothetical protein
MKKFFILTALATAMLIPTQFAQSKRKDKNAVVAPT